MRNQESRLERINKASKEFTAGTIDAITYTIVNFSPFKVSLKERGDYLANRTDSIACVSGELTGVIMVSLGSIGFVAGLPYYLLH